MDNFYKTHDALLSIAQQKYVDSEDRLKSSQEFYLKSVDKMLETPTRVVMSTGIAFLIGYSLYQYQKNVYQNSCECAIQGWEPKVMRIHSYIIAVMVFISMLNIITLLAGRKPRTKATLRKSLKQVIRKNNL